MEGNFGELKSEANLYTPLYKIFFILGILTLSVFSCFLVLIQSREQELQNAFRILEREGQKSFSTLTGYHLVVNGEHKRHIYTYMVTDEFGKLHETSEYVDDKSHLRLRVGNTVITRQKKFKLAGKEKILSRIEGNKQTLPNYNFLEKIGYIGIGFSLLTNAFGFILFTFKRKKD